jgi:hypothetical protein
MLDKSLSQSKQYYISEVEKYKNSKNEVDIVYVSALHHMIDYLHRH